MAKRRRRISHSNPVFFARTEDIIRLLVFLFTISGILGLHFFSALRLSEIGRIWNKFPSPPSSPLRSLVQYGKIPAIDEQSVTAPSGEFAGNPLLDQEVHGRGNGGEGERGAPDGLVQGQDRLFLQRLVDAQGRAGAAAADPPDTPTVLLERLGDALRGRDRALRGLAHAVEEEIEPSLPIAGAAHVGQEVVVGAPVLLQVQAQGTSDLFPTPGG